MIAGVICDIGEVHPGRHTASGGLQHNRRKWKCIYRATFTKIAVHSVLQNGDSYSKGIS